MWPDFLKLWRKQNNHEWVSRFRKAGIQPTILPVLLFLFLTRLFVAVLQKAMTEKKKVAALLCAWWSLICSGFVCASLYVVLSSCQVLLFCVFPSVWSFLHKALAAALARGVVAVAAPGLCHPVGSACCAESPGTPTAMDPALDSPLVTSLLSEASLYPVFSKASAGLDYLWISCAW